MGFDAKLRSRGQDLARLLHSAGKSSIANDRQPAKARQRLAPQFETLADKVGRLDRQSSDIAARPREARDQTAPHRVGVDGEDDGDRGCRPHDGWDGGAERDDDVNLHPDELGGDFGVPVEAIIRPAILNREVAAFGPAKLAQPFQKCGVPLALADTWRHADISDCRHFLLRTRCKRRRNRSRAAKGDELPPPHSITSSAVASSVGGTVRPSNFAVCKLMTSSNLLDCITGRTAGFSPLRMRLESMPTWRYASARLVPELISPPASANSLTE